MKEKKPRIKYESLIVESVKYRTFLTKKYKSKKPYQEVDHRLVKAFISGTIVEIFVKQGKPVEAGDPLLVLEAMKMRNIIKSPLTGIIKNINVKTGVRVIKNELLIELE